MAAFPEILIQLHYHLRPGGVTTVINRYSDTFAEINKDATSFVIASKNGKAESTTESFHFHEIAECDYSDNEDPLQFFTLRKILFDKIEMFLREHINGKSAAIIFHNMSLAKNPSLSSAFRVLSQKWASSTIRFYSVMHDFSEEGRVFLMDRVLKLEAAGLNIREELYGTGAPINYIVPSLFSYQLLKNAGFSVSLLQNPIVFKEKLHSDDEKTQIIKNIETFSEKEKFKFNCKKTIFYYPARLISRKNILEAIAIVCIGYDGTLLTGPSGSSDYDKQRLIAIRELIRKYDLSVVFDTGSAIKNFTDDTDVVPSLYSVSDFVISTSIAEGFGYSLYEPWAFDKPVIARKPSGFIAPQGWSNDSLYQYFPVPLQWVSLEQLKEMYETAYNKCYMKKIDWNISDTLFSDRYIDFGLLNEQMQMDILNAVLSDSDKLHEWKTILQKRSEFWPGLDNLFKNSKQSVFQHKSILNDGLSQNTFLKKFSECISLHPSKNNETMNLSVIQKKFQSSDFFRLLLNPEFIN